jgi:pSer/pThr/pTyr-binding forkhead associated (FHA) protein
VARYLYLTPMLGGPGAPRYPITETVQQIGRSDQSDIALFEPTVSRKHATVQDVEGEVELEDLGSKHGTFVNSKKVTRTTLKVGDIVVFGLSLVLRVEESPEPIPPVKPLKVPSKTPTMVSSIDNHLAVAARRGENRRKRQPVTASIPVEELPHTERPNAEQLLPDESIAESLLPEAHRRLSELHVGLLQMIDDGTSEVDPYPIIASLEAVLAVLDKGIVATYGQPEVEPEPINLYEVIRRAVKKVTSEFAAKKVKFWSEVSPQFVVQADAARLIRAIIWLLRNAGRASTEPSPVEIMAALLDDKIVLTISHLGTEYPTDVLDDSYSPPPTMGLEARSFAQRLREVRDILADFSGEVSLETRKGIGSTVRLTLISTAS